MTRFLLKLLLTKTTVYLFLVLFNLIAVIFAKIEYHADMSLQNLGILLFFGSFGLYLTYIWLIVAIRKDIEERY